MKSNALRVVVCGALGRMGTALRTEIAADASFFYAGGIDSGKEGGAGKPETFPGLLRGADVAVDFSCPEAACACAAACARAGKPFVTGTTGFSKKQFGSLKSASSRIPVFFSPNMSPAVNLTFALAAAAARRLKGFDIHISEAHHASKKDAPSGTALRYAEIISGANGGIKPSVTSVRAGDIVGDHTVLFAGPHERVELTHRAHSRAVFASGALKAAAWLAGRKPGFYDYFDLLDLRGLL